MPDPDVFPVTPLVAPIPPIAILLLMFPSDTIIVCDAPVRYGSILIIYSFSATSSGKSNSVVIEPVCGAIT